MVLNDFSLLLPIALLLFQHCHSKSCRFKPLCYIFVSVLYVSFYAFLYYFPVIALTTISTAIVALKGYIDKLFAIASMKEKERKITNRHYNLLVIKTRAAPAPCRGGKGILTLLGYSRSNRKMAAGRAFCTARYTITATSANAYTIK